MVNKLYASKLYHSHAARGNDNFIALIGIEKFTSKSYDKTALA